MSACRSCARMALVCVVQSFVVSMLIQASTILDLGTLGGLRSSAAGINEAGQVVGSAQTASGQTRAFLFTGGTMIDLGALGSYGSEGFGLNDNGDVVGGSTPTGGSWSHPFLYSGGVMTDLGTLGHPIGNHIARAISSSGMIVGQSRVPTGETQGFVYLGGVMTPLGGFYSDATDVNDSGQVVGSTKPDDHTCGHAFV